MTNLLLLIAVGAWMLLWGAIIVRACRWYWSMSPAERQKLHDADPFW